MKRVNLKLQDEIHAAARKAAKELKQTLQAYVESGVIKLLPKTKTGSALRSQ